VGGERRGRNEKKEVRKREGGEGEWRGERSPC